MRGLNRNAPPNLAIFVEQIPPDPVSIADGLTSAPERVLEKGPHAESGDRKIRDMAGNGNPQLRPNEVPVRYSLERGESFLDGNSATLAKVVGGRLRAIYPVDLNADEPAALRFLLDELAAKGA
jgi:hypothetical protein